MSATPIRRTITVERPGADVLGAWSDPDVLRRVFGHVGTPAPNGPGGLAFTSGEGDDGRRWQVRPQRDGDQAVRLEPDGDAPFARLRVEVRPAPHDLGTEMTLTVEPASGGRVGAVLDEAAAVTAARRLKALLETGEIPTLDRNPHARHTGHETH